MAKMTKETLRRGTEQREAQEAQWTELQQLKAQDAELLDLLQDIVSATSVLRFRSDLPSDVAQGLEDMALDIEEAIRKAKGG